MKNIVMKAFVPILMAFLSLNTIKGQNLFKPDMLKVNPMQNDNATGTLPTIKIHENFLQKSIQTGNDLYHLYALIYLYKDYYKRNDFVKASKYLLEAEQFADKAENSGWTGIVNSYRAAFTATVENNPQLSIKQFKKAILNCSNAGDSLCIGESYEQISTKYNELGDYKKAHYYFKIAEPLLQKFGSKGNICAAYNNYSTVFINQKEYTKAIYYIKNAIAIARKHNLLHSEMVFLTNLCEIYIHLKQYDEALKIIDASDAINKKNNWRDILAGNYLNRSIIYENQKLYKPALEYLYKYQNLKEEISGETVLSKISDLEAEAKEKEYRLELLKNRHLLINYAWICIFLIAAIAAGAWFWRRQNLSNKKRNLENRENLTVLTNLLLQKNKLISDLENNLEIKPDPAATETDTIEHAAFNKKILTDSDWQSFKDHFEKVYPDFTTQLRKKFPAITEAEERLFLLLKLNLRTKKIAAILGISNDSVKKNRNRLRKRLNLNPEEDLTAYVLHFEIGF